MTNPRDVTLDIVGKDHTEKATRSAANNLDKLAHKADEVDEANKNLGSRAGRHLRKLSDALRGVANKLDTVKRKTEDGTLAVRSMGSRSVGSLRKLSRALDEAGDEADQLKRKVNDAEDAADNLGKRGPGHIKRMTNAMIRSAKVITSIGPLAVTAAIVVALGNLPLAATIAGMGIVAGLGGALTFLGVRVAAQNEDVLKSFKDLKRHVLNELDKMAKPFVPVLQRIAGRLKSTFDGFAPILQGAFKKLAPVLDRFSEAVLGSLDKFKPAIDPIVDAFTVLADSIGAGLPSLMQDIATAFTDIADAIADNPQAITDVIISLGHLIKAVGKVIAWLIRASDHIDAFEGSIDSAMLGATAAMGRIAAAAANMAADVLEALARIPGPGQATFRLLAAAARASADATQRNLDRINTRKAQADIRYAEARLRVLGDMKPTPKVNAEIAELKRKIAEANRILGNLDGKTATVTVNYRSRAWTTPQGTKIAPNLSGGVSFAQSAPGGNHRTGGPAMAGATVNATTYVTLDGREIAAHVRTIISEATGRQAFRARSGRR